MSSTRQHQEFLNTKSILQIILFRLLIGKYKIQLGDSTFIDTGDTEGALAQGGGVRDADLNCIKHIIWLKGYDPKLHNTIYY